MGYKYFYWIKSRIQNCLKKNCNASELKQCKIDSDQGFCPAETFYENLSPSGLSHVQVSLILLIYVMPLVSFYTL